MLWAHAAALSNRWLPCVAPLFRVQVVVESDTVSMELLRQLTLT